MAKIEAPTNWSGVVLVWDAYQNDKITVTQRDNLLAPWRAQCIKQQQEK